MEGIIVVDKPAGFTSFDVVAKLRGICATRKIGHGGTLDPMATGVLPVFVGTAAKAVDLQPQQDKTYEGVLQLGIATDTGDVTGEVLRRADVTAGEAEVRATLPRFVGEQQQLPPMYSAVKIAGKPLYKYAREGKEVQRKARGITVYSLQYLQNEGEGRHRLRVHCSKGTYIRTLVEDIGAALGLPATLAALRRTQAGVFGIGQAHTLETIQAAKDAGNLQGLFLPVEEVFMGRPALLLDDGQVRRLQNGADVYGLKAPAGPYRARGPQGFVGLVEMQPDGLLKVEKIFAREGQ